MIINKGKMKISLHARERATERYGLVVDRTFVDYLYRFLESLNIKLLLMKNPIRLKIKFDNKDILIVVGLNMRCSNYKVITFLPCTN